MDKKKIAVIFGGESSEHKVSCVSGTTIIDNIDKDKYDVIMIGITQDGNWLLVDNVGDIVSGKWRESNIMASIVPDKKTHGALISDGKEYVVKHIDVVFPVLHGLYGEDGTIQGLLEMSGIPYVGCGVLASAMGMDKLSTKKIVDPLHIRQAKYVQVLKGDMTDMDKIADSVEAKLGYPVFVKPSNAGSSVGVSKASDRKELIAAVENAAKHDCRILIEEMIVGREIECAVFGADDVTATGVGEILAAADFYDYDAKYNNSESKTVINPKLPEGVVESIQKAAKSIFKALDGFGLARVDFFVENETNEVVFNEINTMPGFTEISMYPMLWEAEGVDKSKLVGRLIELSWLRGR